MSQAYPGDQEGCLIDSDHEGTREGVPSVQTSSTVPNLIAIPQSVNKQSVLVTNKSPVKSVPKMSWVVLKENVNRAANQVNDRYW